MAGSCDVMSCVLRISAPGIEDVIGSQPLQPYRFEDGWAHFTVSNQGFRELDAQIEEAIAFLKRHTEEIVKMMDLPSAEGWLDFGIAARSHPMQRNVFPPELVCLAGKAGIGLGMSVYSVADEDHPLP